MSVFFEKNAGDLSPAFLARESIINGTVDRGRTQAQNRYAACSAHI